MLQSWGKSTGVVIEKGEDLESGCEIEEIY